MHTHTVEKTHYHILI